MFNYQPNSTSSTEYITVKISSYSFGVFHWNPIEPVRSNRIQGLIVGGERICIRYHCAVRTSGMSTYSIEIANSTELHNILLMLDTIAAPFLLINR